MKNERNITLAVSGSRFGPWANTETTLGEFVKRLESPQRSTEIQSVYNALPKKKQDDLKDVGGFVGGTLNGTRKAGNVQSRDLITLDVDKVSAAGLERTLSNLRACNIFFILYSTRKHTPQAPRFRVIIPMARPVAADEYEPIARYIAKVIDGTMEMYDQTTFQPERLMYFPSVSSDSEYLFEYADAPLADGQAILSTYEDWTDSTKWALCPYELDAGKKLADKQENPTEKEGIIGAFCRTYDVYDAIDTFIPGTYETCETEGRMTFAGGSTSGGAIIYGDGLYLYSHHGTDPCSGKLVNAFDLVRLHKYGELDDDVKQGTPANRYPSFQAMSEFASKDSAVMTKLKADKLETIQEEFADFIGVKDAPAKDVDTEKPKRANISFSVEFDSKGNPKRTMDNAWALMETDPVLKDKITLDIFNGKGIATGPYPWDATPGRRIWNDNDDNGIQWYLEKTYNYRSKTDVLAALSLCGNHHSCDPVREFLDGLVWDGVERLDTCFIDYLGAKDCSYIRAVTRKSLVAAVARTYQPGCKYDQMLILAGKQGVGKSTILNKLGKDWFNDNLQSFEGRDAKDSIQGFWICEIGELGYMNKTGTNQVKQFLSQREDIYRAAYGRNTVPRPRRCVFFGTSNEDDYLKDTTGNRRFWCVDVGYTEPAKCVFSEFTEDIIDQIWAEAVVKYRAGEKLFLDKEDELAAQEEQENHRQVDPREGIILDYLDQLVPLNYYTLETADQRAWGIEQAKSLSTEELMPRQKVCASEIWENAFKADLRTLKPMDVRFINSFIKNQRGWEQHRGRYGDYGVQRGYIREGFIK